MSHRTMHPRKRAQSLVSLFSLALVVGSVLLTACGTRVLSTSAAPEAPARAELRVGDPAPDFTLLDQNRQPVQLSSFRGKTVQLAFYVWAFSGG